MLDFDAAYTHFLQADTLLADLLQTYRTDPNRPLTTPSKADSSDYVQRLYQSIISQQISTKAASKIRERFLEHVGDVSNPSQVLLSDIDTLRSIGLSRQKANYIRSIAEHAANKTVAFADLDSLDSQSVIDELIKINGIGQWTAEMFLMFTLARPDVFSTGDLGLLNAAKRLYDRPNLTKQELADLSLGWAPHRTTAALVLWHSLDNKPTKQ